MREQWQIDQGKRCGCKGSDEYCPCQNVSPEQAAQVRGTQPVVIIRDAMQDLLNAPKGVVPDSAAAFFDTHHGRFSTHLVSSFLERNQ